MVTLGESGPKDDTSPPPGRAPSPVVQETIEEDEPEEESYELADRMALQVEVLRLLYYQANFISQSNELNAVCMHRSGH